MTFNNLNSDDTMTPLVSEEAIKGLYVQAYQHYEGGKYEDAVHFFRFLTTVEMTKKRNWMGLGASLQMVTDFDKAIEAFAFATLLDENDPYPHIYAAECLFSLGKMSEGSEALAFAEKTAVLHEKKNEINSRIALLQHAWCHEKTK